jgi:transposase
VQDELRPMREIANTALKNTDELFAPMYPACGGEFIAPDQLLRGLLLQALYGLRSERLLCEQLEKGAGPSFRWQLMR